LLPKLNVINTSPLKTVISGQLIKSWQLQLPAQMKLFRVRKSDSGQKQTEPENGFSQSFPGFIPG
jgi:hypothetical protein